jgi:hypothetical protein
LANIRFVLIEAGRWRASVGWHGPSGWSVLLPGDGEAVDLAGGDARGDVGRGEDRQAWRVNRVLSATSPCILASGAPRQKWIPAEKLR